MVDRGPRGCRDQNFFFDQCRPLSRDPVVTFIAMAARFGDVEALSRLVQQGVEKEGPGFLSCATIGLALRRALQGGYLSSLRCLHQLGADFNVQFMGFSVLHEAISLNNTEMVRFLLTVPTLHKESLSRTHCTPLMVAASHAHLQCLTLLLDSGCAVDTVSPRRGQTAVHHAVIHAPVRGDMTDTLLCLTLLQRAGADINAQDLLGSTPLHVAVSTGHSRAVLWLLQNNADLELESRPETMAPGIFSCLGHDAVAFTPLLVALHFSNRLLVELLVACGAHTGRLGWTLQYCRPYQRLHDFMVQCLGKPPSLLGLCRTVVRRTIGGGEVGRKVDTLTSLPNSLKRYLLLQEEIEGFRDHE